MLIGFRVLQGLGGGMLMPLGMTIMTRAAGPARMGRLMAILGVPMLLGPIFGPILGGWLIENARWHWIFLINVPIGAIALVYAWRVLASDRPEPSESFDCRRHGCSCPRAWRSSSTASGRSRVRARSSRRRSSSPARSGSSWSPAFVFWSFRPEHPLLDLRLFRNRNLTVSIITMFLFAAAFFGGLLLVPTYFQQVRGETALQAGWLMARAGSRRDDHHADRGRADGPASRRPHRAVRPRPDHQRHVRPDPARPRRRPTATSSRCSS